MRLAMIAALACSTACGSSPPTSPTPVTAAAEPGQPAPSPAAEPAYVAPPFSADDLRAGLPVGTEIVLRIETAGEPTVLQHWSFTAADAGGCTIHARVVAEDGSLISDEGEGTSTWAELETHAHFPADRTTRTDSHVDVAAGSFDTWLFEVRPAGTGEPIKRLHFATALPGPPVLMEVERDGVIVMRMELVSRTPR